ncbi:MAG: hypothetical protein HPY82_18885 [Gammaproteobacteria bacterium]|nr:hypothetical protein [Gammaproteobacteria bacterium]
MPTTDLDQTKTDFLKPMKQAFIKSEIHLEKQPPRRKRQNEITTIFTCLKNNLLKLPPQRTIHEPECSRNMETSGPGFHVLIFGFCITLELSGPRQRLRLNDLLYMPLILTVNLCFDLDCTEPARHYWPVCTKQTTDLDQPDQNLFFKTNETGFYEIRNSTGNTTTRKKQKK